MVDIHIHPQKSTNVRVLIFRFLARWLSRLAPPLAVRLAERLFLSVPRPKPPNREASWAEGGRRFEIDSAHGPLAAWEWGSGERTVLLVHGWAGRGLQLGALVEPLTERGLRVVAVDLPGHGASPGRTSSLPEMVDGLAAVTDHLGRVDGVMAHSLGTLAVIVAMARGVLRPAGVVAIAPPARFDAIGHRFAEMTGFSEAVVAAMRRRIEERFGFPWADYEPLRLVPLMEVPLAVVHDRDDREVPFAEGAALADSWPGARMLATTGLGHRRVLRDQQAVLAAVEFLDQSVASQAPLRPTRRLELPTLSPRPTRPSPARAFPALVWRALHAPTCSRLTTAVDLEDTAIDEAEIALDLAYGRE